MELRFEPKFYREHLGEKSDHKSLIQDFQPTRPEGYGLTRYLQDQAFVDEESGNIRTYLIRQKGTGELVGYYSIRAGNTTFITTAHVTQTWLVDEDGDFIEAKSDCDEVTHAPDAEDLFTCSKCGAEVPAKQAYSE